MGRLDSHRFLIVGHGARETSMANRLQREGHLVASFSTVSNYGLDMICGDNAYKASSYNPDQIVDCAQQFGANIIIPGNEIPLYAGLADIAEKSNLSVFGPKIDFCRFEKDKLFSRAFANEIAPHFTIPAIGYYTREDLFNKTRLMQGPYVVKIWNDRRQKYSTHKLMDISCIQTNDDPVRKEILLANKDARQAVPTFIVEEFIDGYDFSIYVVTNGKECIFTSSLHDFPFLLEGETGAKTGGMGCISGVDHFSPKLTDPEYKVARDFIEAYLERARHFFTDIRGMFSFQFIRSSQGIKFNEVDVRPGDPEMVNFLSLLHSRFDSIVEGACSGTPISAGFSDHVTLSVYLVAQGYPLDKRESFFRIDSNGINAVGCEVHMGPSKLHSDIGKLSSVCSRAFLLSTVDEDISKCSLKLEKAFSCNGNDFSELHYRRDILFR